MVLPEPLAPGFLKFAEDTYINSSYFTQGIVHEYIRRGLLEPNIARLKDALPGPPGLHAGLPQP
jgi:DNA-binding transcriptional MocR family regulator